MPVVMATDGGRRSRAASFSRRAIPAFTLIDLVVSIAIIALLISLMLPSLSGIREATRRVICQSNQKQVGLCMSMYQDDSKGELPPTDWDPKFSRGTTSPQNTIIVRKDEPEATFDGLGILFISQYLNAPQVFYCPSHHGSYPLATYGARWREDQSRIVVNFQYRGPARFAAGQSDRKMLVTDGLATRSDYNHNIGSNALRADYSVAWIPDFGGSVARLLPLDETDTDAATKVNDAWQLLDTPASGSSTHAP